VARELARPLEIESYALNLQNRHATKRVTDSFKIRDRTTGGYTRPHGGASESWAEEIETACVSSNRQPAQK